MALLKSLFFAVFLLFISHKSLADTKGRHFSYYYPESFHKLKNQKSFKGDLLKEKLFEILSKAHLVEEGEYDIIIDQCPYDDSSCFEQRKDIDYKEARQYLFGMLHLELQNKRYYLTEVYCHKRHSSSSGVGRMKIPNHLELNCEHTWPQSRFNPKMSTALQKTDLHHLYPVDSSANSSRGNSIFGDVEGWQVDDCEGSYRGVAQGTDIAAFEPPQDHKGNVARAIFYFSTRFKMPISRVEEKFLRQWHELDPVDHEERERNQKIMDIQKNRNPFIDYPELVNEISDF